DHIVRVDDEGSPLRDAGLLVQNAKLAAELVLDIRDHREGEILQVRMMSPPRCVDILVVGAAAKNLAVAIRKLAVQLAEGGDLRRTNEGEILGPEEVHLPLTRI